MGWLRRLTSEAVVEAERAPRAKEARFRWTVDADDFGFCEVVIENGDMDGSGEAPGVQFQFQHEFTDGPVAAAFSAREAELIGRALTQAAACIRPSERLRQRTSKWRREQVGDPSAQPAPPKVPTVLKLTDEEAQALAFALKGNRDSRLRDLRDQIEVPF